MHGMCPWLLGGSLPEKVLDELQWAWNLLYGISGSMCVRPRCGTWVLEWERYLLILLGWFCWCSMSGSVRLSELRQRSVREWALPVLRKLQRGLLGWSVLLVLPNDRHGPLRWCFLHNLCRKLLWEHLFSFL